jgi:hypothetical protein
VNALAKLRYLGIVQTARKFALKTDRVRRRNPPPRPPATAAAWGLHYEYLGHRFDLDRPDRWHYSPDTGRCWPWGYGPSLPVSGPTAAGDVKLIWELNRHQFLPALARQDPDLAREVLTDWLSQNPAPWGINWSSAMEVGLRLIAWLETLTIAPQLESLLRDPLATHARFVARHLSADWIPRNNHLIAEAAALACYGRARRVARLQAIGERWLAQARREQFYPSGANREQALAYHEFVTHLFELAGQPWPPARQFLAAVAQPDGSLPPVGDHDDGHAAPTPFLRPAPATQSVAVADAGYYVLRHGGDYCLVRCGEFGLPPNYAHAHADLLSPILWLGGQPILTDPGTFTYNGDAHQRRWFRSAHAHNSIVVDERDYAQQAGTFAWRHPPRGVCEATTATEFCGRHDAYRDLGITIQRRIEYRAGAFVISDSVAGRGRHRVRWRFQLHPRWPVVSVQPGGFAIGSERFLEVRAPTGTTAEARPGAVAPRYNQRVDAPVCQVSGEVELPVQAEFILR